MDTNNKDIDIDIEELGRSLPRLKAPKNVRVIYDRLSLVRRFRARLHQLRRMNHVNNNAK